MKTKICILLMFALTIVGCVKDAHTIETNIDGNYFGTFERNGNISNVEISFNNGIFEGEGDVEKFPAICKGSFSISDDIISFENDCIWTATLDWTLILSGDWSFTLNNNLLIMTHTNGDQYILTQE
jgi:hypothetical protein